MFATLHHTTHLFRIGLTLARHNALSSLKALPLPRPLALACRWLAQPTLTKEREGQRLARAFEALGPSFIKVGQALSTRPDLVGDAIAADLTQLQDNIPPFDTKLAIATIEQEFGKPIVDIFPYFETKPVAAASIAQVHFARTATGEEVAVKILRPDIEKAFSRDLELMKWIARIIERRRPSWRRFKPVETIGTIENHIRLELDLRYEAAAASELKDNMKHDTGFFVPDVFWQYTSERVLTTARISGIPVHDLEAIRRANIDCTQVVTHAANAFFHQVFRDGFFHADMHPGNLFVQPDGTLAAVDFGIMGRLDLQSRIYIAEILWGFLKEDYHRVAQVHVDAGYVPADQSVDHFAQACRAIAKPILDKPLHEISIAKLLGQLFKVAETFKMETQPQLLMLQKTMMLAEGVGRSLNPQVNMWKLAEPLIAQWAKDNLTAKAKLRRVTQDGLALAMSLPKLIENSSALIEQLRTKPYPKPHEPSVASMSDIPPSPYIKMLAIAVGALMAGLFAGAYIATGFH